MNHIDKMRIKDDALQILGVAKNANAADVRAAWKRKAFELHPDRNGGSVEEFDKARMAYEMLRNSVTRTARPVMAKPGTPTYAKRSEPAAEAAPSVRRPRIKTRIIDLAQDAKVQCKALLDENPDTPDAVKKTSVLSRICGDVPTANIDEVDHADHMPRAVRRKGRKLSYLIKTPLGLGANRVALPTGELTDRRKVDPKMVRFTSGTEGKGTIEIPEEVRADLFPGAQQVRIHFCEA